MTGEDGQWLSYAELAELRGITRKAAARLALRHRWRRQPGNDGATRVLVPPDIKRRQTARHDGPSTPLSDGTAIAAALDALREQLTQANGRADAAEADRRAAIALAEQTVALLGEAVAERDRVRAMLDRSAIDLDVAHRLVETAQERADALAQAEAARKGRGRLARLRAAWRGE